MSRKIFSLPRGSLSKGLALCLLASLAAAETSLVELEAPHRFEYRAARDLNGDGIDDLIVLNRETAWVWLGARTGLSKTPSAKLELPKGVVLFDLADVDGDRPGQELLLRTHAGYFVIAPGMKQRKLPNRAGPGLPRDPDNLLWRRMTLDLDRDDKLDLVDVSLEGYRIDFDMRAGGSESVLLPVGPLETSDTKATIASERYVARYALGIWTDGHFTSDAIPDFAMVRGSGIRVFPGGEKGRPDGSRHFDIKMPEAEFGDLTFLDINSDTKTDVVAVNRKAGQATILIAMPGALLAKPGRVTLKVPGRMRYPVLSDFNGDQAVDLAIPYHPQPDFGMVVQAALRGEIPVKVPIFLNHPGRPVPFRRLASESHTFPVRIRVGADASGRLSVSGLVIVEYGADLDGDGRKDLVVSQKTDRLVVHPGRPGRVFHEDPAYTIPVPDSAPYKSVASNAANLNGDNRSDIILHYRGTGKRPDRLLVLLSGKK
ncbi:MAG: VCBS repeat-containing protein [Planctomycetota bacterium]